MTSILEAQELNLKLGGGQSLFTKLSLAFREGELAVLAGRNGAGKTVLAKCLAGIIPTKPGRILFRGQTLSKLPGSPATRVAYLFQDTRLQVLGDSALDDARFGPLARGLDPTAATEKARAALELVGLGDKAGRSPIELSGGEQRRLGIASILALDPSVLILDEPFANLDWEGVATLLAVLSALRTQGKTLIVLTHELEKIVGLADRLIVMDSGGIALDGTPARIVGEELEIHGLRNPLRPASGLSDLQWLEGPAR